MNSRRFLEETFLDDAEKHSPHCVCKGTGEVTRTTHGTTGLNGSTPIQGNVMVPCPYGDLGVNKRSTPVFTAADDEWDL